MKTPFPSLMTTSHAARYLGYRTTGALRKAHLEKRIFPVGRRGGRGTWMWAVADLDRFLRGEPPVMMKADRSDAPLHFGDAHDEGSEVAEPVEQLGEEDPSTGSLENENGRRPFSASASKRSGDGSDARDSQGAPEHRRSKRPQVVERREGENKVGNRIGPASKAALRRLRDRSFGAKGTNKGDQEPSGT